MANAKKCDRCGKFYEKNLETSYKREVVVGVSFINTRDNAIEDRDLCDECIAKFKRFMAGCELREEMEKPNGNGSFDDTCLCVDGTDPDSVKAAYYSKAYGKG
jgi:hypothetical protein